MVHFRLLALWVGLIAIAEGLFSLALVVLFGDQDALALAGGLVPGGLLALLAWVAMTYATAQKRADAEAALRRAAHSD
jgi:hypothetical protein